MIRGLFSGIFWGLAACVVVVGAALLLTAPSEPLLPEPEVAAEAPAPARPAEPADQAAPAQDSGDPPTEETPDPEMAGEAIADAADPAPAEPATSAPAEVATDDSATPEAAPEAPSSPAVAGTEPSRAPAPPPGALPPAMAEVPPASGTTVPAPRAGLQPLPDAVPAPPEGHAAADLDRLPETGVTPPRASAPDRNPPSTDTPAALNTDPPAEPRQPAPQVMAEVAEIGSAEVPPDASAGPVLPQQPEAGASAPAAPELAPPVASPEAPVTAEAPPAPEPDPEDSSPGPVIAAAPAAPPTPSLDGGGTGRSADPLTEAPDSAGGADSPAVPEPDAAEVAEATPAEPEAVPPAGDEAPARPGVLRIGQDDPQVRTNRLPQIGGGEEEAAEEPAALDPVPAGSGALARHRAPFDNPDGRPVIAVVLMLGPGSSVDAEVLSSLPFPVTLAVDMAAPELADAARAARAAGREVMIIPDLPRGAAPSDVEVALAANVDALPEAVALMSGPGTGGFQGDRNAVAQVVAAAGATGHGLVTFPQGFNTAQQLAVRDGVPVALVFRELDGSGEDSSAIGRVLDQAAFRARQEGAVILAGRARPETVTALTEWALGNRAASVALAPVSAVLLAGAGS